MMSSGAGKVDDLLKVQETVSESGRSKVGSIAGLALVTAAQLASLLGLQGLMSIQVLLKLNMCIARNMVNKDTATGAHLIRGGLACRTR
jgi:hypothetical protein